MRPPFITDSFLRNFISTAFAEDIGDGDHSSLCCIPEAQQSAAALLVKDDGVLAGVELALEIFRHFDPQLLVEVFIQDGAVVKKGQRAFEVHGSARSILTCERLVLNCMQRMSGVATKTKHLTGLIAGTGAKLLDTRKTTPNFRLPEKWAVAIGGGVNHRLGLYDMIMLKDNHIDIAGGVREAILRAKDYLRATNRNLRIEVETRSLQDVEEVLKTGAVDVIMLDNMSVPQMKEAVMMIGDRAQTEASGGITEETIRAVAETGVNFISVGALTHSFRSLDLSLKAIK